MDFIETIKKIEHDLRDAGGKCSVCGKKTNNYFIIPGKNPVKVCNKCFSKSIKKDNSSEE